MRGSVLFFTFVFATIGCGSDPATDSELREEPSAQDPAVETGVRPPVALGMDQIARIEARSPAAEETISDRAVIQGPYRAYCPSPPLCAELHRRLAPEP